MLGRTFNQLTVSEELAPIKNHRVFSCRCACGAIIKARGNDLRSGQHKSCGCLRNSIVIKRNKRLAKHNMTHTGVYRSWFAMRDRCEDLKSSSWQWYGAKGVRVCERWQDFKLFFEDMGDRPDGKTLDRIDPAKNYEPGNCRWATPKEQRANQRDKTI